MNAGRIATLAFGAFLLLHGAAAAKQLAVVVGNDAYQEVTPLVAGVNDARAMTAGLKRAGFMVELVENGTKRQISRAFATIESKIEPGDTVVFHYSGHGFEIDGQNWLLPVDVPAAREGEAGLVKDEAFNAADVIDRFRAKGAGRVVAILDACRNNPFARSGTRALSGSRGLARMDPSGGVFIMFSAGAKQEALDRLSETDPEKTSIFVRSFLPLLDRSDLTLIDMAKETQERVRELARSVGHDQTPAYYDGIVGRVTLTGLAPTASAAPRNDVVRTQDAPVRTAPTVDTPKTEAPKPNVTASLGREVTAPEIEACDRAAASPFDTEKPMNIPGVEYKEMAGQSGVLSCLKAAEVAGTPRRIFFQLGRSYGKIGNGRDAAKNYAKAAELKHPIAMHNLGVLYLNGNGVDRDYSAARVWFELASQAGIAESLREVGILYETGKGAPRDYHKAMFYYQKGVEAGEASSYSNLGSMYLKGLGIAKNQRRACELYAGGASMGNPDAAANYKKFCGR